MLTKRKDGRYVKKITLPNGTEKYFYSSAKTERAAMTEINKKIIAYEQKTENECTFTAVADRWDTEYRRTVSDLNYRTNTRAAYKRIVDYFGNVMITDIDAKNVDAFLKMLASMQFSKQTVKHHKGILNMIFNYAMLNNIIQYNPVSVVKLPQNLHTNIRDIPPDSVLSVVKGHYTGFDLLPYFLLYTGLRRSEALAVTYDDIDFNNKTITVNKKVRFDNNRPVLLHEGKTANSARTVLLLDRLAEKIPPGKGFLFANDKGELLTERQFINRWNQYKKRYGIKVTPHQLRHAYATMLFEADIDVKDAQQLMGHSDIALTRKIYTHIREARQKETLDKLNKFDF